MANVCFCWWMCILASQYITTTAIKKKWTNHSLLFNANALCWNMSLHSVITWVLMAHAWDLNSTRWYLFKLNSCKLCQFKPLSARGRKLAHAQWEDLCMRSSERVQILNSLWSIVFEWTNSLKKIQNAHLGKYPIADIAGWMYCISEFS